MTKRVAMRSHTEKLNELQPYRPGLSKLMQTEVVTPTYLT